jgi:SAM-dependent methyltransferase
VTLHSEAYDWVLHAVDKADRPFCSVLEIGCRNINGTVRHLFGTDDYFGVDISGGWGVDVVADATVWRPDRQFGGVVCCEVAEHCEDWPLLVECAFESLSPGGTFIFTAAGPGRAPHSGVDGGPVRDDEFYGNVEPEDLIEALNFAGFLTYEIDILGPDIRAVATKGA